MIVDHRGADTGSIVTCIGSDMYSRFLPKMDLPDRVVVMDIGANVGGFPLMLHINHIDMRKLVCVELNPNTYERLRFNIRSNLLTSAEIINAGVVKSNRELSIELDRGSPGDSIRATASARASKWRRCYDIKGLSLDSIYKEYLSGGIIDICKIDVEGAEDEIVLDPDSENNTLSRLRYLIMEIHHVENLDALLAALQARGLHRIDGDDRNVRHGVHLFRREGEPSASGGSLPDSGMARREERLV
jgi:FkbM family methyltransferase